MIQEAFRVLKPNGKACLTAWGRRERCLFSTLRNEALKNLRMPEVLNTANFIIGENLIETHKLFSNAGFS